MITWLFFFGGRLFDRSDDPHTKMQVSTIIGDICLVNFKRNSEKSSLLEQALFFYDLALQSEPNYPLPRWNRIEALTRAERTSHLTGELDGLCNVFDQKPGEYADEARMILRDWENVLGSDSGFEHWKSRIEAASVMAVHDAVETRPKGKERGFRKALMIALLASVLSGTSITVSSNNSAVVGTEVEVSQPADQDSSVLPSVEDRLGGAAQSSDIVNASVEIDHESLMIMRAVEMEHGTLV